MDIKKRIEFNDIGQKLTLELQLKYGDLSVFEYPRNCYECPVGFHSNGLKCGRNVSFKREDAGCRPETCKLVKVEPFKTGITVDSHKKDIGYKMCSNSDMAIDILEFIKQNYVKHSDQAGVQKYIEALDMGIDALKVNHMVKCLVDKEN